MVKDKLLFSYQMETQKCPSCFLNHDLLNCPIIRFVPNREKIYKNKMEENIQIRSNFTRSSPRDKFNSLMKMKEFKKSLFMSFININEGIKKNPNKNYFIILYIF